MIVETKNVYKDKDFVSCNFCHNDNEDIIVFKGDSLLRTLSVAICENCLSNLYKKVKFKNNGKIK